MAKRLLLIGGGGHCRSVIDSLLSEKNCEYEKIAAADPAKRVGEAVFPSVFCVGSDDDLERLHEEGFTHAFVSVGSVGDPEIRIRLTEKIKKFGFILPDIIDNTAVIGTDVSIGQGVYVGKNAVVNCGATVGDGAILNTGCIVEHQCVVGEFCHIAPGAVLCGNVSVGERTHIGAGAVVIQGVNIGKKTIIGAGAVVTKDQPDGIVAYGNPCRIQRDF